jgi:hypothetical protein
MTIATGQPRLASDINDLTFFPRGTILTFSTEAYNTTSAEFKNIWKICDGQNGTPDLVNKFLRGGTASGTTGGADSQSITLSTNNLPNHRHSFKFSVNTDGTSTTTISWGRIDKYLAGEGFSNSNLWNASLWAVDRFGGSGSNLPQEATESVQPTGGGQPFTVASVPQYYTVIYIMKVA